MSSEDFFDEIFGEDTDDGINGNIFHEGSGIEVTSFDNGDIL